jgi:hypothetical protein
LQALKGGIGSDSLALRINSNTKGNGGFVALAEGDVNVLETTGDLKLITPTAWTGAQASVQSVGGNVTLQTLAGSIINGVDTRMAPVSLTDAQARADQIDLIGNAQAEELQRTKAYFAYWHDIRLDGDVDFGAVVTAKLPPSLKDVHETLGASTYDENYAFHFSQAQWDSLHAQQAALLEALQYPVSRAIVDEMIYKGSGQDGANVAQPTASQLPNVMGANVTLLTSGGVGNLAPIATFNLTSGISGLNAEAKALLAAAEITDVVGVTHAMYRYVGPANASLDLQHTDFKNGALWQIVNPSYTVTAQSGVATLATGTIVQSQLARSYGIYQYLGRNGAAVDLARTDYSNTALWKAIAPEFEASATAPNASISAARIANGQPIYVQNDGQPLSITLQLAQNLQVEASGALAAEAGGSVGITSNAAILVDHILVGDDINLHSVQGAIIDAGTAEVAALRGNGDVILDANTTIGAADGTAMRVQLQRTAALYAQAIGKLNLHQVSGSLTWGGHTNTIDSLFAERVESMSGTVQITLDKGDLTVGRVKSHGNTTLTSPGNVLNAYDDSLAPIANISSDSGDVFVHAGGNIGTADNAFDVALGTGSFNADAGGNIFLHGSGVNTDLHMSQVSALGNANVVADANVFVDSLHAGTQAKLVAGKSILRSGAAGATNITAVDVDLTANGGTIGVDADALLIESSSTSAGTLTALATGNINITQKPDGTSRRDLNVRRVESLSGDVQLSVDLGSILNAGVGNGAQVLGGTISLLALQGAIGSVSKPLEVDSSRVNAGKVNASSRDKITITEVAGAFNAGTIASSLDDVSLAVGHNAVSGADFIADSAASVIAAGDILIRAGANVRTDAGSVLASDKTIAIEGDMGDLGVQGSLATSITIAGALRSTANLIEGGPSADFITLSPTELVGWTRVLGNRLGQLGGNDTITLDQLPAMTKNGVRTSHVHAGTSELVLDTVDLDGNGANNHYIVNLSGAATDYTVNVHDSGGLGLGPNYLTINGTTGDDTLLMRANFVANLTPDVDAATSGHAYLAPVERVNYDNTITGRLTVNGVDGYDHFYVDDNSAITTIDGGLGRSHVQIGQVFGADRKPADGTVAVGDEIRTVETTMGYLSRGISYATTVYGAKGDDQFIVYSNQASLKMYGAEGSAEFVVRAFVLADKSGVSTSDTTITGGSGDTHVEYNINAPVSIQGGKGVNTVVVLGTEKDDNFVITKDGVRGAGLNTTFTNVQKVEVDGLEGNDHFYVLSTSPDVITTLIGGGGSDTFDVAGDVTSDIIALDANGTSAYVNHSLLSDDPDFNGAFADGVSLSVAGNKSTPMTITQPTGSTTVVKGGASGSDVASYSLKLNVDAPTTATVAYLAVSAAMLSAPDRAENVNGIEISIDGVHYAQAVVLTFDSSATGASAHAWDRTQTIYVRAIDDTVRAGDRSVLVSHALISSNPAFNGTVLPNVDVKLVDAHKPGVLVSEPVGGVSVIAGGADAQFNVKLTRAPALGEIVTVSLKIDASEIALTAGGSSRFGFDAMTGLNTITFDASNWNTDFAVTVQGTVATKVENPLVTKITSTVDSTGGGSSAVYLDAGESSTVNVTKRDARIGSLVVTPITVGTSVAPNQPLLYSLRLTKKPTADVVVSLLDSGKTVETAHDASDTRFKAGVNGQPDTVTFNADNWDQDFIVEVNPDASVDTSSGSQPVQVFPAQPHTTYAIQGSLILEGDVMPNRDRSLHTAVMLPSETDQPLPTLPVVVNAAQSTDTLRVFNDGSKTDDTGTLGHVTDLTGLAVVYGVDASALDATSFGNIGGLNMGGEMVLGHSANTQGVSPTYMGGVTYHDMQIVNVMMGAGGDDFTVGGTTAGSITVVQGGGGDNTLTATGGGGVNAPLVLFGSTSQDGQFYNSSTSNLSGGARIFTNVGNNTLDASGTTAGVVLYGGSGNDTLIGGHGDDLIAGGGGDNTIDAGDGNNQVYGNAGFNIDLSKRLSLASPDLLTVVLQASSTDQTITHDALTAGRNTISAGNGDNIVFANYGVVDQVSGTMRLVNNGDVTRAEAVDFGVRIDGNKITLGNGNNWAFGNIGQDEITAGNGNNVVFGDEGAIDNNPSDAQLVQVASTQVSPDHGGIDTLRVGDGNSVVLGGVGADVLVAGNGNNILFGDNGLVTYVAGVASTVNTTDADQSTSGSDRITASNGDNLVMGGLGDDVITLGDADATRANRSVVFGDSGQVTFDADGFVTEAITTSPQWGGQDVIATGKGDNIVIAGNGDDTVTTGEGNAILIGDNGEVRAQSNVVSLAQSIDHEFGGNDTLVATDVEGKHGILIGGTGNDELGGSLTYDVLFGDNGAVTLTPDGKVTSVTRYAYALNSPDLIAKSQDAVFTAVQAVMVKPASLVVRSTQDVMLDRLMGGQRGAVSTALLSQQGHGSEELDFETKAGNESQEASRTDKPVVYKKHPVKVKDTHKHVKPNKAQVAPAHQAGPAQVKPVAPVKPAAPVKPPVQPPSQPTAIEASPVQADRADQAVRAPAPAPAVLMAAVVATLGQRRRTVDGVQRRNRVFDAATGRWRDAADLGGLDARRRLQLDAFDPVVPEQAPCADMASQPRAWPQDSAEAVRASVRPGSALAKRSGIVWNRDASK